MKSIIKKIAVATIAAIAVTPMLTSCNDYLDVLPKGSKYPKTFADYAPLLNDEYRCGYLPPDNALYLMNDVFLSAYYMGTENINRANFLWEENADRVKLNKSDEMFLYYAYSGINVYDLIVNLVPGSTDATQQQKDELIAQARVLRAFTYYQLVNFYSDAYQASTASNKGGVPIILGDETGAQHTQPSVQGVYDFILNELNESMKSGLLPETAKNILLPSKYAAHAVLAKVYLSMGQYDKALSNVNEALKGNSALYDWNALYTRFKTQIEDPNNYTGIASPMGYDYCENVLYRSGINTYSSMGADKNMPMERVGRFEKDNAEFLVRWKKKTQGVSTYMQGITNGYFNKAGITTSELYLIKAECEARANKLSEAMATLNKVRKTRILADNYSDLTASNTKDAIEKIIAFKDNVLVQTIVPFIDARRLNAEGMVVRTFTKEYNGQTLTLKPDSHLWTMVFPAAAVNNPGNGTITQNSK